MNHNQTLQLAEFLKYFGFFRILNLINYYESLVSFDRIEVLAVVQGINFLLSAKLQAGHLVNTVHLARATSQQFL